MLGTALDESNRWKNSKMELKKALVSDLSLAPVIRQHMEDLCTAPTLENFTKTLDALGGWYKTSRTGGIGHVAQPVSAALVAKVQQYVDYFSNDPDTVSETDVKQMESIVVTAIRGFADCHFDTSELQVLSFVNCQLSSLLISCKWGVTYHSLASFSLYRFQKFEAGVGERTERPTQIALR